MSDPTSSTMAHHRPPGWAIVASCLGVALVAVALGGFLRSTGQPEQALAEPSLRQAFGTTGRELGDGRSGIGPIRRPTTTTTAAPDPNLTPVAVAIPAIGVRSSLISLGLNPDRTLEVPKDFAVAGWYRYRPVPGNPGPSVIAGHVDSRVGPAVFYRLKELAVGATINVERSDGTVAVFTVTGLEQHGKDAFPTERVYGPTSGAELRLITCGGTFDWNTRHYVDNLIVFAALQRIQ